MDRTLRLLRHTTASWDDASLADHERPLAPRGVRSCALLADHLRTEPALPDLVLCSTAVRTRETLDGISDALPSHVERRVLAELYAATAATLLEQVRRVPDGCGSVLLIAHNPSVGELAAALAQGDDERIGDELQHGYPTGALTRFDVTAPWAELGPATATLRAFVTPRQLG